MMPIEYQLALLFTYFTAWGVALWLLKPKMEQFVEYWETTVECDCDA